MTTIQLHITDTPMPLRVVVVCHDCGHGYTRPAWDTLPFVGEAGDGVERLQHRRCPCGRTLALSLGPDYPLGAVGAVD
jgi:hypothetical protein